MLTGCTFEVDHYKQKLVSSETHNPWVYSVMDIYYKAVCTEVQVKGLFILHFLFLLKVRLTKSVNHIIKNLGGRVSFSALHMHTTLIKLCY